MASSPDDPWRVSWEAINASAWWHLEHSATLPPSVSRGQPFHGLPRLLLWDDPAGLACEAEPTTLTVYEIFTADHRRRPVVREAVWRRSSDLRLVQQEVERTNGPVMFRPNVRVRDAAVPADRLAALLAEAARFRVPVMWFGETESVTSDAGARGFEFYSRDQPPAVVALEWSFDTPAGWEPMLEWCGRLRRFLEGCLSETTWQV